MRARDIIFEGYREARDRWISNGIDPSKVDKYINLFRDLVNRNQVQGNERNIDWWVKNQGYQKFINFVADRIDVPSKKQIKQRRVEGRSIFLDENDDWLIVIPLDKDASCFHGRKTSWCTAMPNRSHYEEYFYTRFKTLVYFINKKTGRKWAMALDTAADLDSAFELFNQEDETIDKERFEKETGIDLNSIRALALEKNVGRNISSSRREYREKRRVLSELMEKWDSRERNNEIEKLLIFTRHREYSNQYFRRLAAQSRDQLNKLPIEIQSMAVSVDPENIKNLENPKSQVIESAVFGGYPLIDYIVQMGWPITDRIIRSYLTDISPARDGGVIEVVKKLVEHKINISEKVMREIPLDIIWYLIKTGYDVPEDLQLKYVKEYTERNIAWTLGAAEVFDSSSDRVKLEIVLVFPEAVEVWHRVSETLRIAVYKTRPSMFDFMVSQGFFPSRTEQRALKLSGYTTDRIKSIVQSKIFDLSMNQKEMAANIDRVKKEINQIYNDLADLTRMKINAVNNDRSTDRFDILFSNLMKEQDRAKHNIEYYTKWFKTYRSRLFMLEHGIERVGYIS